MQVSRTPNVSAEVSANHAQKFFGTMSSQAEKSRDYLSLAVRMNAVGEVPAEEASPGVSMNYTLHADRADITSAMLRRPRARVG